MKIIDKLFGTDQTKNPEIILEIKSKKIFVWRGAGNSWSPLGNLNRNSRHQEVDFGFCICRSSENEFSVEAGSNDGSLFDDAVGSSVVEVKEIALDLWGIEFNEWQPAI